MKPFFQLQHQSKKARLGVIHTPHGDFETPAFMPVGTQATVKTLDPRDLKEIKAQIILANAYHLHLRPGEDVIAKMGGLHQFMGWNGPILTDSGGFQVFSLQHLNTKTLKHLNTKTLEHLNTQTQKPFNYLTIKPLNNRQKELVIIDNDGVTFRSHLDGSLHRFTPESATEIQHKLGADIIMAFDQCTRDDASRTETLKAMKRTHEWAERCLEYHLNMKTLKHLNTETLEHLNTKIRPQKNNLTIKPFNHLTIKQYLFGIIQGGRFKSLRLQSANFIASLPFDGLAIGGETIGYNMPRTQKIMNWIEPLLPKEKPRYTMGVGFSPADLFAVVELGIDMFDCVAPTRLARNGALYISPAAGGSPKNKYRLNIANFQFIKDPRPIDPWCDCPVCQGFYHPLIPSFKRRGQDAVFPSLRRRGAGGGFSRAYLNHLFRADELLALRLASLHNVRFMLKLMEEIRRAIKNDSLKHLKKCWL